MIDINYYNISTFFPHDFVTFVFTVTPEKSFQSALWINIIMILVIHKYLNVKLWCLHFWKQDKVRN